VNQAPPGRLRSVITYLEMHAPPWDEGQPLDPQPPVAGVAIEALPDVSVADYRAFYRQVGEPWLWCERLTMADADFAALLANPRVEVRRLSVDGRFTGYSELDRRQPGEVEIVYFGLVPDVIGMGLGRFFLHRTLIDAWASQPRRVWLHTCTEDHPGALVFYEDAGFRRFRSETVEIEDPRLTGLLPRDAAPHIPLDADDRDPVITGGR